MKSILEELFYGNICPNTDCRSNDEQTKELMVYIADHRNALKGELTDKQKEILEKFDGLDEISYDYIPSNSLYTEFLGKK